MNRAQGRQDFKKPRVGMEQGRRDEEEGRREEKGKDEVMDWDFALRELAAAQGKLILSKANINDPKV